MRVVFLGTSSAIPAPHNGYTSLVVEIGSFQILVDTGDNPVKSLLECSVDPKGLDAVVLTHTHVDHLGAFPSLISALDCMKRSKSLTVVGEKGTLHTAQNLLKQFPLDIPSLSFPLVYTDRIHEDGFILSLREGRHAVPTSMVYLESSFLRLLYTSDYCYGDTVTSPGGPVDILIHEATYPHAKFPPGKSHSSALQAGIAARESKARMVFLCHFEVDAYKRLEDAGLEARSEFEGEVIVPRLQTWYTIPDSP
jgi:putative mRNA 3-end processing factor